MAPVLAPNTALAVVVGLPKIFLAAGAVCPNPLPANHKKHKKQRGKHQAWKILPDEAAKIFEEGDAGAPTLNPPNPNDPEEAFGFVAAPKPANSISRKTRHTLKELSQT